VKERAKEIEKILPPLMEKASGKKDMFKADK
jgi:hypothetical protein